VKACYATRCERKSHENHPVSEDGHVITEGSTLVSVTENLGRTLLLVAFEGGHSEYLFEHEVELNNGDSSCRGFGAADGSQAAKQSILWSY